jgi:mRNA interferase YafQ
MIIRYTNRFEKDLKKLSKSQKRSVANAMRLFSKNPFEPSLKNHKLGGKLRGVHAFFAEYDLRILYREEKGFTIVIMLRAGKHDDVYR